MNNVLTRQLGIMSDLGMGEGREFVDYNENQTIPAGGVIYNWGDAGDLKDYTGTAEQWATIQVAQAEMKDNNTIIIATYEKAKNATVRLKLDETGNVWFTAPDGAEVTLTESGAQRVDAKHDIPALATDLSETKTDLANTKTTVTEHTTSIEELNTEVEARLPLTGGTMTGQIQMSSGNGLIWKGGSNIRCVPTGNNSEYSIDLANTVNDDGTTTATGTYFQVWGDTLGTIFRCNHDDGSNWMYRSLTIANGGDAAETTYNSPHLTLGASTGVHLEIDNNEILAKANASQMSQFWVGGTIIDLVSKSATGNQNIRTLELNNNGLWMQGGVVPALNVDCIYAFNNGGGNSCTLSFANTNDVTWGFIQWDTSLFYFRVNASNSWSIIRLTGSATMSGTRWQSGTRSYYTFTSNTATWFCGAIIL